MSHRSRAPSNPRNDSAVLTTTLPRSSVPTRPRLDTRLPSSETRRRPGLPSSPRDHLRSPSSATTARPPPSNSARSSPNLLSSRSAKAPSPFFASRSAFQQSQATPSSQREPVSEDVPLFLDQPAFMESSSFASEMPTSFLDPENDTVFGVAIPSRPQHQGNLPPRLIPELQALVTHVPKQSWPPAPPSVSTIGSPSTRFTESPAPWSASTATTTPLSWASVSPAVTQTHGLRIPDRNKTVPQPTPPRSRLPRLPTKTKPKTPPKDNSATATISTSAERSARPKRKKSILDGAPPTPSTRTSSMKRDGRSGNTSIDETVSRLTPSRPSTAPSSAHRQREVIEIDPQLRRMPSAGISTTHDDLQSSIAKAPVRPSRSGTLDLGKSRPAVMNTHRAGFSPQQRQVLESGFEEVVRKTQRTPSSAAASDSEQSVSGDKGRRSPSRLGKFSRFRLFGQREQPQDSAQNGPNRLQRRGPAAGTGHEGYNKHTKRGRKQSTESSAAQSESERSQSSSRRIPLFSHSRKISTTSRRTSQSDLDEFAVPRMRPVVMRGGSQTSVVSDSLATERANLNSPQRQESREMSTTPVSDVYQRSGEAPMGLHQSLRPATSHGSGDRTAYKSLAVRRSQRLNISNESPMIPAPIRIDYSASQPVISSYDTTVSSNMPSSTIQSTSSADHYHIDPSLLRDKKSKRRWWNPFRTRQTPTTVANMPASSTPQPEMAVSIATGPAPRMIPYYAMLESESDINAVEGVGLIQMPTPPSPSPEDEPTLAMLPRGRHSVLLPEAPSRENLALGSQLQARPESPLRQPRLAQIGRIPKVVTRTERQHRPSRKSFSQPFSKPTSPMPDQEVFAEEAVIDEPPQLQIHTDVLPSRPFREADNLSAKPASAPARTQEPPMFVAEPGMLDLEPVTSLSGTDRTTSSSSAGLISIMGPPMIPAYYEQENHPFLPVLRRMSGVDTDDVWNEYDDIIDHVMSPSRSRDEPAPEAGLKQLPRQIVSTSTGSPVMKAPVRRRSPKGKLPLPEPRQAFLDLPMSGTDTPPVILPSPSLPSERSAGEEIRLRRSRIISALHSSYNPTSPFSMREFLKDYSEIRDSTGLSERLSTSTAARSTLMAAAQYDNPVRDDHQHNAAMLDVVGRLKDPIKESELHYASLEVSRWLSFGRVLFSPAQDEIYTLPDRAVLVIDGLGNEDWAIYCAVTYESAKAVVYDLKEKSHYKKPPSPQELEHLPTNLRRAEIASFAQRFPFHTAFFSVIVLRFPPAMSEATMKNVLTECRRILVPGGHIEIMLLDLDFVNMGVQTRRAVRELKMRMATKNPDVNLKPSIDHFQTVLGSRGFTGLNRCIVGVPVVGKAPGSTDSSTSSTRSSGSHAGKATGNATPDQQRKGHGRNFSLSDLVTDPSESADAQIGRMVSKTARNWWQHCYEAAVLPQGDVSRSIFAEKRVLQECKTRGSSLKLLIAHAQRPVFEGQSVGGGGRRRMTSEGSESRGVGATANVGRGRRPS